MAGYIGNVPVPQATQTRDTFTATSGQISFATSGYTPNFLDVYLNGVKLASSDYTATNGSDVVLASGAAADDIVDVVAFNTFEVNDQDFSGDFSVDGSTFVVDSTNNRVGIGTSSPQTPLDVRSTSNISVNATSSGGYAQFRLEGTSGVNYITNAETSADTSIYTGGSERMRIDSSGNLLVGTTDNTLYNNTSGSGLCYRPQLSLDIARESTSSASYMLSLNNTGVDAKFINFGKDGTSVGSIGTNSGNPYFIRPSNGGIALLADSLCPADSTGAARDGAYTLGKSTNRFSDLYLSGGVHLGGTGSANYLDDYETGTFTPSVGSSGGSNATLASSGGHYTKIGRQVTCFITILISSTSGMAGNVKIQGFPFSSSTTAAFSGCPIYFLNLASNPVGDVLLQIGTSNTSHFVYEDNNTTNIHANLTTSRLQANTYIRGTITYFTD